MKPHAIAISRQIGPLDFSNHSYLYFPQSLFAELYLYNRHSIKYSPWTLEIYVYWLKWSKSKCYITIFPKWFKYIYIILLLKISVKNVRKLGLSHTRVVIATLIEQKKAKHSVPSISTLRQTPNTNTCLCSCKSPTRMFRTTLIAKFKTKNN